ncbi:hypothetical protein A5747_13645 [Mycobacterium sp. IS-836]|uniref:hypothetical protein n=1 Tax=Mycobacterium sp. IS-836 TaxID=1834160 RepID=UPI00096CCD92|nr:hypothetical protein [Mycobacterium sp. IS-836]OMC55427.1 hypothetical protein A5747_13645 [Mycobacterium sp. IS-836]
MTVYSKTSTRVEIEAIPLVGVRSLELGDLRKLVQDARELPDDAAVFGELDRLSASPRLIKLSVVADVEEYPYVRIPYGQSL